MTSAKPKKRRTTGWWVAKCSTCGASSGITQRPLTWKEAHRRNHPGHRVRVTKDKA